MKTIDKIRADAEVPTSAPSSGQDLCLSCGLCCDGSLFGRVILDACDDRPAIEAAGVAIDMEGDSASFRQPCACLDARACTIYACRPGPCRRFRCQLLAEVQDGSTSMTDALAIVRRAQMWRHELLKQLGRVGAAPKGTLNELVREFTLTATETSGVRLLFGGVRAMLSNYFKAAQPAGPRPDRR